MDITFVQSFNFQIIRQEFFHIDTTSMPLKVLVLGHSFVRRLETDIINQVHPVLSPNIGLVNSDVVVQYLGFSGGNIFSLLDDPNNRLDATLRAFPAYVIVLQIGGNDIDQKEFDILLYKASVRHLIFRLQELYQVKKVVICGIFPRFKLRKVKLDVYHEKKEKNQFRFLSGVFSLSTNPFLASWQWFDKQQKSIPERRCPFKRERYMQVFSQFKGSSHVFIKINFESLLTANKFCSCNLLWVCRLSTCRHITS